MPQRRTAARFKHIAFVASDTPSAQKARRQLVRRYGDAPPETADVIVALGGDGLMLATLQRFMNSGKPIYGMHRGTVGFLMNEFSEQESRRAACRRAGHGDPSAADARARRRRPHAPSPRHQRGLAVPPELSGGAAAHPRRRQGAAGRARCRRRAAGDARPARPPTICRSRDRSFRSARRCLRSPRSVRSGRGAGAARCCPTAPTSRSKSAKPAKRPVAAVADHNEVRSVRSVEISMDHNVAMHMLFDPGHSLDERILREQFGY